MLPLFALVFCGSLVWFSCKCISFIVLLAALIADHKVEFREKLNPLYLSRCQFLSDHEILEVFVIYEDLDWQIGTLEL